MVLIDSITGGLMEEFMNLEFDEQQNCFSNLLPTTASTASLNTSLATELLVKPEDELTLLNISANKPSMTTTANSTNAMNGNQNQSNPQTLDHLLKIFESQEKENQRILWQFRMKQELLEYLKAKKSSNNSAIDSATAGTGCSGTGSCSSSSCSPSPTSGTPSMCSPHNHIQLGVEDELSQTNESKNQILNSYPMPIQSPSLLLTPPISPDIGQQFFINNNTDNNCIRDSKTNLTIIGLNSDPIEKSDLLESFEKYCSDSDEQQQQSIEDEDMNSTYDDSLNGYTSASFSSAIQSTNNTNNSRNSKRSSINRRKQNSSSSTAAAESQSQLQKRSAHLSAEFRYRTKLNDKITKLRNIVGPKSQLSKSGVLSRSIDLITKQQKSIIKLKEENNKIRLLLMQAYNQLPNNSTNNQMFIQ